MPYVHKVTLEQLVAECEQLLNELGFCNFAEVGRRLNVSRQTVHKRLRDAADRGEISPETVDRYRYTATLLNKRFNTSLTQDNYDFIHALADQLEVPAAYILDAAINRYRQSLLDNVTLGPLLVRRQGPPGSSASTP